MHHQQTMLLLGDEDDDNNSLFGLQSGSSFNRSNASINNSGGNSGAFNSNNNNNNKSNFGLIGSGINTPVVGSHQHSVGNNFNSSFSTRIQNNVFTSSNQSNSDVNKGFPMNQGSNRAPGSSLTANPLMQHPISSETSTSRSIQDGLNNSTVPINSMNSWGSGSSFYSPFSIQQTSSSNEFFSSTAAQHPFKTSNSSNFQQQHASLFPSNVTTRNSKINSTTSSRLSYLSSTLSLAEDDDDKFMGTTNPLYEDSTQQQSQQYLGRNTVTSHGSSTSTLFSTSGLSNQHQHTPLTHASSPSTSSTSERTSPGNSISYSNENTTTPSPPPPQFLSSTPEYHNRVMGSSIPIIGNGNTSQLPFNNIGGQMNFIPTSSAFPPNAFHQQAMFGNVMFMNASNAMPTPTNLGPQMMPNIGMGPFILTNQPMGFVPMSGNSGFVNNSQQSSLNVKQSSTASSDEKNPKPTQTNNLEKSHLTSQPSTTNTAVPPQQNVPQISPIPPTDEIIKQQNINGTKNIEEPKNTGIAKQSKPTTSNSSTNLKEEKIPSKSATKQSKKQKHKNEETTSQPTITAAKDTEKTEQEKLDEELAKKLQREFEMEYLKSLDAGSNRNKGFISTSKKKKGGESTADTIEDTKPSAASSTSSSNFFSILESTSTTDTHLDASKTAKKSTQPPQQPSASKSSKKSKKKKKAALNEAKEAAASNAVATTTNINRELQIQEAIENNLPKGDASNTTPTSPQESIETTQTNVTVTTDTNLSSTKKTSSENYNKPCKDHFKGKCKFGSGICPYSHDRSFYVKYQQEHPDEFPPLPQPKSKKKDTSHEMVDHTPQKKVEVCVKHSSVQACPNGKNCKYIHFSDISQHDLYRKCCTGHSDRICKCAPQNASPVLYVEGVTKLSKKQMQEIAEKSFMKPVGVFKMTEQELVSNLPELKTLSPNEKKQRRFCYIFPDTCVKFVISKIERSEANRVKKLFNETEEEENRKRKAEMQGQKYDQEKDDEANPTWQILGLSSHQHCILRFIEERLPLCFVTPDCDRYNEGEPFDDALYGHHITFKQRQSYPTIIERIFEMVEPDDEPEEDISKELLMMMLGKVADAKKNSTTGFFTMGCIGPFQM
ncbi:hypothetical protein C9374_000771 [Naegleria lovaniensis]|uniref:C3H1-type domain-containing protein n=1 Tax=Naegleria lovaniensis TaxID=51637 RepID=A0AA88GXU0_NAELO|nr:uncharacterized protein C9374_000771 [Naegleria lovaniensis]KAG2387921.1 hypothetical protein C9374_000771 [Naegleria lovaniensis]